MSKRALGRGLSALLPDADEMQTAADFEIPIREIRPNPLQPRRSFKAAELSDLASSIKTNGVIQPLIVRKTGTGYELIAGERRLRASGMAGLKTVPVRVLEVDNDETLLALSLVENLQRDDLNPVELAEGYRMLSKKWRFTQDKIASTVGRDRATISNTLRLLELPDTVLSALRSGEISTGHAKAILGAKGDARRSAICKMVIAEGMSVRQTEEIVRAEAAVKRAPRKSDVKQTLPELRDYIDRLRRSLGTQVRIVKKGSKGSINIEFYSEEDLTRLIELLENSRLD